MPQKNARKHMTRRSRKRKNKMGRNGTKRIKNYGKKNAKQTNLTPNGRKIED